MIYLDFETSVTELEGKIAELRALAAGDATVSIADEVKALEKKASKSLADLYVNLTPWQKPRWRGTRTGPMRWPISMA